MLEAEIESKVCAYAKTKGLTAEKFTSPNRRSVPDRMFTGPNGLIFFIEFKATGKKGTIGLNRPGHPGQQYRDHERRRANGFRVYVVDDIEEGKRIVLTETAFTAFSLSKEGDRVFAPSRPGDDVAGHGPW